MEVSSDVTSKRGEFGGERYEQTEFQQRVAANFSQLREKDWKVISCSLEYMKSQQGIQKGELDLFWITVQH